MLVAITSCTKIHFPYSNPVLVQSYFNTEFTNLLVHPKHFSEQLINSNSILHLRATTTYNYET